MAWWRRDPSLWTRSPAHRYAQRILRDHEAVLRTRCFSRTPSNTAQHQEPDGTQRPDRMTDQEWAQLQRYRRWRKILQEHPYKGLFGASEDMLRGKGLTDWEWVYRTFPKWMLQEMDPQEPVKGPKEQGYGDRSEARSQIAEETSTERKPTFAQPAIRTTHYERDEFGIVSPSDLRRPKEGSHVKVVGRYEKQESPKAQETTSEAPETEQNTSKVGLEQQKTAPAQPQDAPAYPEAASTAADEANKRESSFIDAFFAGEPTVYDRDLGNSKSWRQTALQRRATSNVMARSKAEFFPVAKQEAPATVVTIGSAQETFVIPSSQALVDNYPYPRPSVAAKSTAVEETTQLPPKEVGPSVPEPSEVLQKDHKAEADLPAAHLTSSKLDSLPKDDIDFLSAEEIRAAMGRRKSGIRSTEEKSQERQKLEHVYAAAKPDALDETVEGHVLNNHFVRRVQQELQRVHTTSHGSRTDKIEPEQNETQPQPESAQMETSIDRMRRWIEEGGTSLAKHFWQEPIEAGAPSEADMQFAKQMTGLGKSRRAREHISDDLEEDLPMVKGLLDRLKNDENRVEHAVYLLRTPRKVAPGTGVSNNLRAIRERRLRNTYERTEKQFESACQALRDLDAETIQKATNAFKRRLGIASRVLHKNHTLTRMLTWSAQARLDEPDLERSKAELYNEILTRLATLRDTQVALARLMDLAIQTYGVSLKPADEALSRSAPKSEADAATSSIKSSIASPEKAGAKFLADTAAAARLTDEIESQKAAMKGLSDDGYARAPKQTPRSTFEEKSPLAHSLFRPFNLQLESLGNRTEGEKAEERLKDAFKQKMGDKKLVQEVRSAYEDTYGPITVDHRQSPRADESSSGDFKDTKAFEMLKDDPVSQASTDVHGKTTPTEIIATTKPMSTDIAAKDDETAVQNISSPVISEAISSESSTTSAAAAGGNTDNDSQNMPLPVPKNAPVTSTANTETTSNDSSTINLPTHYTILVHDPQTDALSITTSTSGPPRDSSPALPIHQALSSLKAPAKFIPYISPGLEIVTAKRHMLVLRDALDQTSSTRAFQTFSAQPSAEAVTEHSSSEVNPIDGTTRLSPTGYSGVEQSREQLEKDFEERRQAAAATEAARSKKSRQEPREEQVRNKKRGGLGGVVKTAIWAGSVCYVVGVAAEVLR